MKDMPPVVSCEVEGCYFNLNKNCHAPAINIGGDEPVCDTFVAARQHVHRAEGSQVGACHVKDCRFNQEMICHASGIKVLPIGGHADCATFQKK